MLKSRNSFFSQSSMNYQNYYPNQMIQPQVQQASASNSFYQGPAVAYQNPNYQGSNYPDVTVNNKFMEDYDNRLAKIERAINRLDARITKLENANQFTTNDINNTMYMV